MKACARPMAHRGQLVLRLATEGEKSVLASSLAATISGLQDLIFHLGDGRMGYAPTTGRHRTETRNNFGLRVTNLKSGSAILSMALPAAQETLQHQIPEAELVKQDLQRLLALLGSPDASPSDVVELVPDAARRRMIHGSMKRLLPAEKGHFVELSVAKKETTTLRRTMLPNATRLLLASEEDGEVTLTGRVTKLAVDRTRSMMVDSVDDGQVTVHYDANLESTAREALGSLANVPVIVRNRKHFLAAGTDIEELDNIPIESFVIDDATRGHVEPPLHLDIEVDDSVTPEVYLGFIKEFDVVVRENTIAHVVKSAKEAMQELWIAYAACPETELTSRAIELRHRLLGRISL